MTWRDHNDINAKGICANCMCTRRNQTSQTRKRVYNAGKTFATDELYSINNIWTSSFLKSGPLSSISLTYNCVVLLIECMLIFVFDFLAPLFYRITEFKDVLLPIHCKWCFLCYQDNLNTSLTKAFEARVIVKTWLTYVFTHWIFNDGACRQSEEIKC